VTRKHKPGSVGSVLSELRKGTFFANARVRSARRKTPWNLLLLLCIPTGIALFVLGLNLATRVERALLHGVVKPDNWPILRAVAPFFQILPLLLAVVPLSMVIINFLIYALVPPVRRAMDAEDREFPGTGYATGQWELVRVTVVALPIGFILSVLGAAFS
jgi:hypothetical protein